MPIYSKLFPLLLLLVVSLLVCHGTLSAAQPQFSGNLSALYGSPNPAFLGDSVLATNTHIADNYHFKYQLNTALYNDLFFEQCLAINYQDDQLGTLDIGFLPGVTNRFRIGAHSLAAGNRRGVMATSGGPYYNVPLNSVVGIDSAWRDAFKVTYILPSLRDFHYGISVIPKATWKIPNNFPYSTPNSASLIELGALHAGQRGGLDYKVSLMATLGTDLILKHTDNAKNNLPSIHKSWEAGANFSYLGVTWGGSYGYNSLLPAINYNTAHNFWTLGAGYSIGHLRTSLTHFNSGALALLSPFSKLTINSLAVEYNLRQGAAAYLQLSQSKQELPSSGTQPQSDCTFITGVKLWL